MTILDEEQIILKKLEVELIERNLHENWTVVLKSENYL